jgi:replication initiation protein RepC
MAMLRQEVLNLLEMRMNVVNMNGNESQSERHIQNSNPESISDLELASTKKQGEIPVVEKQLPAETRDRLLKAGGGEEGQGAAAATVGSIISDRRLMNGKRAKGNVDQDTGNAGLKSFPLGLVLQACPEIADYGPGGVIGSWRDLMTAAVVVRSMLGVSPSAYEQACAVMGPENAATVMACLLERGGHITSAGGYLRDLTRRAERGEFAIGPMLMTLARANGGRIAKAG